MQRRSLVVLSLALSSLFGDVTPTLASTSFCDRSPLVITRATLWTPEGVESDREVVVIDGLISSVGRSGAVKRPPQARVIDAAGDTLLPGLIDAHAHLVLPGAASSELHADPLRLLYGATARQMLRSGVTSARVHLWNLHDGTAFAARARDDCFPSPRLQRGGPGFIGGSTGRHGDDAWGAVDVADVEDKIRRIRDAGAEWVAIHSIDRFSRQLLNAIVAAARTSKLRVMAQGDTVEQVQLALDLEVDSIEYIDRTPAERYPDELISRMKARGTSLFLVPPVGYYQRYLLWREGHERFGQPRHTEFLPSDAARILIQDVERRRTAPASGGPARLEESARTLPAKFRQLRDVGLQVIVGSDTGSTPHSQADAIWWELDTWRQFGASPQDAIAAATSRSAAALGLADVGRIEAGRRADLVLYRGVLADGPLDVDRVRTVVKGGAIHVDDGHWIGPDVDTISVERITYPSETLEVEAFVARPVAATAERLPVIMLNRGGVGSGARISQTNRAMLDEMRSLASAGYLVIASNYRGGADGGRDEVGGADIADVMNLLPVIKNRPDADANRIFIIGFSRGAQMALQAVRKGFPARAAVTVGAPTDWDRAQQTHPRLAQIAKEHWPDFARDRSVAAIERSAVSWADELSAPVLILHGGADASVDVAQALALAQKMTEARRPYEMVIYDGDDHFISGHREDRIRRTLAWFRKYDAAPPRQVDPVPVVARDYTLEMPSWVQAGLVTFRFTNQGGEPHYFRLMRLQEGHTIEDVLAWRRSRSATPAWLVPAGGAGTIGPGQSIDYTQRLDEGRYVVFCGHPSPDGTFHVDKGMIRLIDVRGPSTGRVQTATRRLELRDHAFDVDLPDTPGIQQWHIVNRSASTHQALLVRLAPGVSPQAELDWFRGGSRGPRPGQPVGGAIEVAAGQEAWMRVDLEPGDYLLLCSVGSGGGRHFDLGMTKSFAIPSLPK